MNKVGWIAWREFTSTVSTKGFIFGLLVGPALMGVAIIFMPMLMRDAPPEISGEVAIMDPTGQVADGVQAYLAPAAMARRRQRLQGEIQEHMPEAVRQLTEATGGQAAMGQALETALGTADLTVARLGPEADLEAEKHLLIEDGGSHPRLALAVVDPQAVQRDGPQTPYGAYELFVREKLDDRIEDEIRDALRQALIAARGRARGLDMEEIDALTHVPRIRPTTVSATGERSSSAKLNMLLPAAFMALLLISVMTGGQSLMTSTIEEKSSRVVEVLLSAVSPMQLMAGKIIGQMCVGLIVLGLYAGLGLAALFSFALLGLVDLSMIFFLILLYLIAYFFMGSLMAAIGAAVNEISEAQPLITPIVLLLVAPLMVWLPISRDPNSVLATVLSYIPPGNTFVLLLRMTSSTPPPAWQVGTSIGVGLLSVYVAMWFAAKIFRIGLLLHGKPPSLRTLVRWVRMA